jgi:hypothetical protein
MSWRTVAAKLAAREGHHDEASRLATEALDLAREVDSPPLTAIALVDAGEVDDLAGKPQAAHDRWRHALALFELKGDLVSAARLRERLAAAPVG